MMMRALLAGGIPVCGEHDPERWNERKGRVGYLPNPHGFYQHTCRVTPGWYARHEGKAVKVHWDCTKLLPQGDYRVALMLRYPAEVARSLREFFGDDLDAALARGWGWVVDQYAKTLGEVAVNLALRPGVRLTPMRYADVVADPAGQFARLAAEGWPLDAGLAAAVVDPALYRSRA